MHLVYFVHAHQRQLMSYFLCKGSCSSWDSRLPSLDESGMTKLAASAIASQLPRFAASKDKQKFPSDYRAQLPQQPQSTH